MIPRARVLTQARKLSGALSSRWRGLKGDVNTYIVDEDRLGLAGPNPGDPIADGAGYGFSGTAEKRAQFMDWLDGKLEEDVLEPVDGGQGSTGEFFRYQRDDAQQQRYFAWLEGRVDAGALKLIEGSKLHQGGHFTAKFIRAARDAGARDGGTRLREAGGTPRYSRDELEDYFNTPLPKTQMAELYQRTFSDLEHITEVTSEEISDELTSALAAGEGPRKVARRINDRIDTVGRTRSRTLARTEMVHSYNSSAAMRYRENGIEWVDILNLDPCEEICEPMVDDNPYPIEEAATLLPARTHPNCEGTISPRLSRDQPAPGAG